MESFIVIANLGRIRSVKLKAAGDDPVEQDHLTEEPGSLIEKQVEHRGDVVTDQSGRFAQGTISGQVGGMSYGDQHNLESELEREALKRIANKIGEIVAAEGHRRWVLAAPQPILKRLVEALPRTCRDALSNTVGADLVKEPIAKLEKRFVGD